METEKREMDKETQRKSRQKMQKKDNAPCNNQLKRTKNGRQKKVNLCQENCLRKSASKRTRSNRIPSAFKRTGNNRIPSASKRTGSNRIPSASKRTGSNRIPSV
jgi:hypothetical protein